jgi:hypothetical protein
MKTKIKRLPPTLLGVLPFKTKSHGPGVFIRYLENSFVITKTKMTQHQEVQTISLTFTDEEICLNPELRLALEVVAGVDAAITVLANHAMSKITKKPRSKRPAKA